MRISVQRLFYIKIPNLDMSKEIELVQKKIFTTFGEVAQAIGYSPLHGMIIGALLVHGKPMSLQEVAKETGYSVSMISLSLDLLEVLGIVKKIKKTADRKLYIELQGDLLESLKSAILLRLEKSIRNSLAEFEDGKKLLEKSDAEEKNRVLNSINILEFQIKRLKTYVDLMAKMKLP